MLLYGHEQCVRQCSRVALHLDTFLIQYNTIMYNYSDTTAIVNDGTDNTVANNSTGLTSWPAGAQAIMAAAGLEPAYQNIMPVATPAFDPPAGTYADGQSVTISCVTTGAVIYYTTDGSTPTSSSMLYSVPIVVSSNLTLNAIAVTNGMADSDVANCQSISVALRTPTFSPPAGHVYERAVGDDLMRDARRHDLLHHRRQHAVELFDAVCRSDRTHDEYHAQGDRDGEQIDGQRRGDGQLRDRLVPDEDRLQRLHEPVGNADELPGAGVFSNGMGGTDFDFRRYPFLSADGYDLRFWDSTRDH